MSTIETPKVDPAERRRLLRNFWPQIVQYTVDTATSSDALRVKLAALLNEADVCGFVPPQDAPETLAAARLTAAKVAIARIAAYAPALLSGASFASLATLLEQGDVERVLAALRSYAPNGTPEGKAEIANLIAILEGR